MRDVYRKTREQPLERTWLSAQDVFPILGFALTLHLYLCGAESQIEPQKSRLGDIRIGSHRQPEGAPLPLCVGSGDTKHARRPRDAGVLSALLPDPGNVQHAIMASGVG